MLMDKEKMQQNELLCRPSSSHHPGRLNLDNAGNKERSFHFRKKNLTSVLPMSWLKGPKPLEGSI